VPPFGVVTDNYHFALSPSGKIGDAAQRGLSPPDPQGTGRSRRRLHHPDALHGRTILRDAQGGNAEEGDSVIHRHQARVRRLICADGPARILAGLSLCVLGQSRVAFSPTR
jgi:hypothetical protein